MNALNFVSALGKAVPGNQNPEVLVKVGSDYFEVERQCETFEGKAVILLKSVSQPAPKPKEEVKEDSESFIAAANNAQEDSSFLKDRPAEETSKNKKSNKK